jgi:hypothetical protein
LAQLRQVKQKMSLFFQKEYFQTKLFANYLGASAEFQRGQKGSPQEQAAAITPMDAVICKPIKGRGFWSAWTFPFFAVFLFDSLVQANFGDLSIHNNSQIFQILLMNCFADSMGRVPEDFYRYGNGKVLDLTHLTSILIF